MLAIGQRPPQTIGHVTDVRRVAEESASRVDGGQMMHVGAGLTAGRDEGTQRVAGIPVAFVGKNNEERAAGREKTSHASHAALEVGDEEKHLQRQPEMNGSVSRKIGTRTAGDLFQLVEAADQSRADFEVAARRDHAAVPRNVVRIRILEGDPCAGWERVDRQSQRLSVTASEVDHGAGGRHEVGDGAAQLWDEEIALVGAEHQHAAERVPFQQARERVAVLAVRIETGELVDDQVDRLVETCRQRAGSRMIDLDRHRR